jgi:hypothetical protein
MTDLSKMTKAQLKAHGKSLGVELDNKLSRAKMLAELQLSEPLVTIDPEVEAATALLAAMAQSSLEAATKKAEMATLEAEIATAEQAAKDAKRRVEHAIDAHRQAESKAKILVGQAASAQRIANQATLETETLASSTEIAKTVSADAADYYARLIAKNT